ncbi:hypothetical protein AWC15_04160 [Mycobacterium lacus]|nr:hypothetical protein AWC15_04160 [Mycobacterium lacus]
MVAREMIVGIGSVFGLIGVAGNPDANGATGASHPRVAGVTTIDAAVHQRHRRRDLRATTRQDAAANIP